MIIAARLGTEKRKGWFLLKLHPDILIKTFLSDIQWYVVQLPLSPFLDKTCWRGMRRLGVIFPTSEWKEVTYQTDDVMSAAESNSTSTPVVHHSATFQKTKVNSNNKKPIQDMSVLEVEIEGELIKKMNLLICHMFYFNG